MSAPPLFQNRAHAQSVMIMIHSGDRHSERSEESLFVFFICSRQKTSHKKFSTFTKISTTVFANASLLCIDASLTSHHNALNSSDRKRCWKIYCMPVLPIAGQNAIKQIKGEYKHSLYDC